MKMSKTDKTLAVVACLLNNRKVQVGNVNFDKSKATVFFTPPKKRGQVFAKSKRHTILLDSVVKEATKDSRLVDFNSAVDIILKEKFTPAAKAPSGVKRAAPRKTKVASTKATIQGTKTRSSSRKSSNRSNVSNTIL